MIFVLIVVIYICLPFQGFAVITIDQNDLSNGIIGFSEDSKLVYGNEDSGGVVTLKLARTDAFFGEVEVCFIQIQILM